MLDFESLVSMEKLVVDNELCGSVQRLVRGIEPKEDFPARPHFEEMLEEGHLLISKHSRKYLRDEHFFPGPVIERANLSRWQSEGSSTLEERAKGEVRKHLAAYEPSRLSDDVKRELEELMTAEAGKHGMDDLPERT